MFIYDYNWILDVNVPCASFPEMEFDNENVKVVKYLESVYFNLIIFLSFKFKYFLNPCFCVFIG